MAAKRRHPLRTMQGPCWVLTPEGEAAVSSADSTAETSGGSQHLALRAAAPPSGHIHCPAVLRCRDGRLPEGWVREEAVS